MKPKMSEDVYQFSRSVHCSKTLKFRNSVASFPERERRRLSSQYTFLAPDQIKNRVQEIWKKKILPSLPPSERSKIKNERKTRSREHRIHQNKGNFHESLKALRCNRKHDNFKLLKVAMPSCDSSIKSGILKRKGSVNSHTHRVSFCSELEVNYRTPENSFSSQNSGKQILSSPQTYEKTGNSLHKNSASATMEPSFLAFKRPKITYSRRAGDKHSYECSDKFDALMNTNCTWSYKREKTTSALSEEHHPLRNTTNTKNGKTNYLGRSKILSKKLRNSKSDEDKTYSPHENHFLEEKEKSDDTDVESFDNERGPKNVSTLKRSKVTECSDTSKKSEIKESRGSKTSFGKVQNENRSSEGTSSSDDEQILQTGMEANSKSGEDKTYSPDENDFLEDKEKSDDTDVESFDNERSSKNVNTLKRSKVTECSDTSKKSEIKESRGRKASFGEVQNENRSSEGTSSSDDVQTLHTGMEANEYERAREKSVEQSRKTNELEKSIESILYSDSTVHKETKDNCYDDWLIDIPVNTEDLFENFDIEKTQDLSKMIDSFCSVGSTYSNTQTSSGNCKRTDNVSDSRFSEQNSKSKDESVRTSNSAISPKITKNSKLSAVRKSKTCDQYLLSGKNSKQRMSLKKKHDSLQREVGGDPGKCEGSIEDISIHQVNAYETKNLAFSNSTKETLFSLGENTRKKHSSKLNKKLKTSEDKFYNTRKRTNKSLHTNWKRFEGNAVGKDVPDSEVCSSVSESSTIDSCTSREESVSEYCYNTSDTESTSEYSEKHKSFKLRKKQRNQTPKTPKGSAKTPLKATKRTWQNRCQRRKKFYDGDSFKQLHNSETCKKNNHPSFSNNADLSSNFSKESEELPEQTEEIHFRTEGPNLTHRIITEEVIFLDSKPSNRTLEDNDNDSPSKPHESLSLVKQYGISPSSESDFILRGVGAKEAMEKHSTRSVKHISPSAKDTDNDLSMNEQSECLNFDTDSDDLYFSKKYTQPVTVSHDSYNDYQVEKNILKVAYKCRVSGRAETCATTMMCGDFRCVTNNNQSQGAHGFTSCLDNQVSSHEKTSADSSWVDKKSVDTGALDIVDEIIRKMKQSIKPMLPHAEDNYPKLPPVHEIIGSSINTTKENSGNACILNQIIENMNKCYATAMDCSGSPSAQDTSTSQELEDLTTKEDLSDEQSEMESLLHKEVDIFGDFAAISSFVPQHEETYTALNSPYFSNVNTLLTKTKDKDSGYCYTKIDGNQRTDKKCMASLETMKMLKLSPIFGTASGYTYDSSLDIPSDESDHDENENLNSSYEQPENSTQKFVSHSKSSTVNANAPEMTGQNSMKIIRKTKNKKPYQDSKLKAAPALGHDVDSRNTNNGKVKKNSDSKQQNQRGTTLKSEQVKEKQRCMRSAVESRTGKIKGKTQQIKECTVSPEKTHEIHSKQYRACVTVSKDIENLFSGTSLQCNEFNSISNSTEKLKTNLAPLSSSKAVNSYLNSNNFDSKGINKMMCNSPKKESKENTPSTLSPKHNFLQCSTPKIISNFKKITQNKRVVESKLSSSFSSSSSSSHRSSKKSKGNKKLVGTNHSAVNMKQKNTLKDEKEVKSKCSPNGITNSKHPTKIQKGFKSSEKREKTTLKKKAGKTSHQRKQTEQIRYIKHKTKSHNKEVKRNSKGNSSKKIPDAMAEKLKKENELSLKKKNIHSPFQDKQFATGNAASKHTSYDTVVTINNTTWISDEGKHLINVNRLKTPEKHLSYSNDSNKKKRMNISEFKEIYTDESDVQDALQQYDATQNVSENKGEKLVIQRDMDWCGKYTTAADKSHPIQSDSCNRQTSVSKANQIQRIRENIKHHGKKNPADFLPENELLITDHFTEEHDSKGESGDTTNVFVVERKRSKPSTEKPRDKFNDILLENNRSEEFADVVRSSQDPAGNQVQNDAPKLQLVTVKNKEDSDILPSDHSYDAEVISGNLGHDEFYYSSNLPQYKNKIQSNVSQTNVTASDCPDEVNKRTNPSKALRAKYCRRIIPRCTAQGYMSQNYEKIKTLGTANDNSMKESPTIPTNGKAGNTFFAKKQVHSVAKKVYAEKLSTDSSNFSKSGKQLDINEAQFKQKPNRPMLNLTYPSQTDSDIFFVSDDCPKQAWFKWVTFPLQFGGWYLVYKIFPQETPQIHRRKIANSGYRGCWRPDDDEF